MGRNCASGTAPAMVLTKAPIGIRSRRVSFEGGSRGFFDPQGGEMKCKMECMAPEKCRFSLCKADDFVFSLEIGCRSACGVPFGLTRWPLGGQNAFRCMIYSIFWMHKRSARVHLGSHGGVAGQSILRGSSVFVGNMSVLCF